MSFSFQLDFGDALQFFLIPDILGGSFAGKRQPLKPCPIILTTERGKYGQVDDKTG